MKKIFLIFLIIFVQKSQAGVELVSARQAQDILKYRAPTVAADLTGKWKKVLHGPTEQQNGQYNSDGIVEGVDNKVMTLYMLVTNLSEWVPQEASTVYALDIENMVSPALNVQDLKRWRTDSHEFIEPLKRSNLPFAAVNQVGDAIHFKITLHYDYKTRHSHYRYPCYWNCGITFKIHEYIESDKSFFIEIGYICALQVDNKDRLICEQNTKIYDEMMEKLWSSYFPKLIGFERVK